MSEECPLAHSGFYWDDNIPAFCRDKCEDRWQQASQRPPVRIDTFSEDIISEVEFGGETLQRLRGAVRCYSVLSAFVDTGDDAFAEEYEFNCPHD